jgi:hypothetical protein
MTTGRINQVAVSSSTARGRVGMRAPPTSAQLEGTGALQSTLKRFGSGSGGCRPPRENTFPPSSTCRCDPAFEFWTKSFEINNNQVLVAASFNLVSFFHFLRAPLELRNALVRQRASLLDDSRPSSLSA